MKVLVYTARVARLFHLDLKTQTRRIIDRPLQHPGWTDYVYFGPSKNNPACRSKVIECGPDYPDGADDKVFCPFGNPGDRLRIKEPAWMFCERIPNGTTKSGKQKWRYEPLRDAPIHYCAEHREKPTGNVSHPDTGNHWSWRMKIGRFLPSWAERSEVEIVEIRVERLNAIRADDCWEEGIRVAPADGAPIYPPYPFADHPACRVYVSQFRQLWEGIYGAGSWEANPHVWVVKFKKINKS